MKAPAYFRTLSLGRLVSPPKQMPGRISRTTAILAGASCDGFLAAAIALRTAAKILACSPRTSPGVSVVRVEMRQHARMAAALIRSRADRDAAAAVDAAGRQICAAAIERVCALPTDARVQVFCENEQYRLSITGGVW